MIQKLACVVGARPNFIKMGALWRPLNRWTLFKPLLVHTGQHYDASMSDVFFSELGLPAPDVHLGVGSGTQGDQTARILARFEKWLLDAGNSVCATLVVGDVNSTLACSLASVKLNIPVIHVEAGLRSGDRSMPEEINRLLTDAIADLLLVSEPSGVANLLREGRPPSATHLVGNVMIDVLTAQLSRARSLNCPAQFGLAPDGFALWTMHRPSNVDHADTLRRMIASMHRIAKNLPVVFPVHPRTQARLQTLGLLQDMEANPRIHLSPPVGYSELLSFSSSARMIITDSGGLQEESTALLVPCLTLRANTERPVTVTEGTSTLVGTDTDLLERLVSKILAGAYKAGSVPDLWDGAAAPRIVERIAAFLGMSPSASSDSGQHVPMAGT